MLGLFRKRRRAVREPSDLLALPLLHWSRDDTWTLRDAVEGTLILGATGSGKTSGSGRLLARTMLACGFGGLVLTAKADERALWEGYCRETNRLDDLIVIGADCSHRFNFLDHELTRQGEGAGLTENIVTLFENVMEVKDRNRRRGGGAEEGSFWRDRGLMGLRSAVDILAPATGSVSVPELVKVFLTAPTSPAQVCDPKFQASSPFFRYVRAADARAKSPRQQHDLGVSFDHFLLEWPSMAERTRSTILATVLGWLDVFNRGLLREMLCTDTTITPEVMEDGKIILIDLPVKEFGEVGQCGQAVWKLCSQRQAERRRISEKPRPLFFWMDEAQHFLTGYDFQFQATCRSAWVATVMLSQNYSNFVAALGGDESARVRTDSLLANLNTKVFHGNSDPVTNEWASRLIGRTLQCRASGNHSHAADDQVSALLGLDWARENGTTSGGFSEVMEAEVEPREFTRLRTGGPPKWIVDGIVFQNGKVFNASGRSWLPVQFNQRT
jgi:hypothetical protein